MFRCRKRFPQYDIVGDADRNTVVFRSDDILYTVEELVAQLIQKAREFAEDSTGKCFTSFSFHVVQKTYSANSLCTFRVNGSN